MLKPSSLVNVRINVAGQQNLDYKRNAEDAAYTAAAIVANLSKEDVTAESVKQAGEAMSTKYYNNFANKTVYEKSVAPKDTPEDQILEDASFYTAIAKGFPAEISYVQIGEFKKAATDTVKVSVGNNGFIVAPMWKISEDNKLMVATCFLMALADEKTGRVDVSAGGITYSVPAMDPIEDAKVLKITDAVINPIAGSNSTVSFDAASASAVLDRFDQAIGVVVSAGDEALTDTSTTLFVYNEASHSVAITPPETWGGKACTYVRYMYKYANRKVDANEAGNEKHDTMSIIIPGKGKVRFTLHAVTMYTAE